jgi:oxalate decarboxylase
MSAPGDPRAHNHKTNISNTAPIYQSALGSIKAINVSHLPILKNLSLQLIELEVQALIEPKWYQNCNLVAYVLEGEAAVSILDTGSEMINTAAKQGEMFYVRSGALFNIENIGNTRVKVLVCLRHEDPKEFYSSSTAAAFTDATLGNTFDVDASVFSKSQRSFEPKVMLRREGEPAVPRTAFWPSPYRFGVEEMQPPTSAEGVGSARKARSQYWKILNNIAMYSLRMEDEGMREIHWHPDTVEMGYIHKGYGRMTILEPNGGIDSYTLGPGDVYFIPASYPHHIESLQTDIHFLIFFDQPMPKDVGLRLAGTVWHPSVLEAAFGLKKGDLPELPFDAEDPLMVVKKNPLDKLAIRQAKL